MALCPPSGGAACLGRICAGLARAAIPASACVLGHLTVSVFGNTMVSSCQLCISLFLSMF